jgi:hypothetical protein
MPVCGIGEGGCVLDGSSLPKEIAPHQRTILMITRDRIEFFSDIINMLANVFRSIKIPYGADA